MDSLKKIAKLLLSDYLIGKIYGLFYGWHGNYNSWAAAQQKCTGYDEKKILDNVIANAERVKKGEIPYERDSVAFDKVEYSFPVLSALMWISIKNDVRLNLLDFGGSLGTSYYQNIQFLNHLSALNWCIVEQSHFVDEGKKHFEDQNLHFFYSLNECMSMYKINAVLLSNVIQYLENPYVILEEIISKKIEYIIVDRTLFVNRDEDRLTIQKVPEKIYKASYCCWFLSEEKFLNQFRNRYDLIYDYNVKGIINIRALYKGYLFKIKEEFK